MESIFIGRFSVSRLLLASLLHHTNTYRQRYLIILLLHETSAICFPNRSKNILCYRYAMGLRVYLGPHYYICMIYIYNTCIYVTLTDLQLKRGVNVHYVLL